MTDPLKVIRYEEADPVAFGPLSNYRLLVGDEFPDLAIRTGIQTAQRGYEAKPHWHPYVEVLHILEGSAEAWQHGCEESKVTLSAGDTLVIPARTWHSFRAVSETPLRLLGTHVSNQRTVHYDDGSTSLGGNAPTALAHPK